jgi:hypothetical protein
MRGLHTTRYSEHLHASSLVAGSRAYLGRRFTSDHMSDVSRECFSIDQRCIESMYTYFHIYIMP